MLKLSGVVCALLLAATTAGAQVAGGRYGPAKGSGPQKGVQTPRTDPAPFAQPALSTSPAPTPVSVRLVPAVLMSDGSIMADFGFGLESVRRPCNGAVVQSGGKVFVGNGLVISHPTPGMQPAPRMQPAPGLQPAPGMQPAPAQQSVVRRPASQAAGGSCFTRNGSGQVFVTR